METEDEWDKLLFVGRCSEFPHDEVNMRKSHTSTVSFAVKFT